METTTFAIEHFTTTGRDRVIVCSGAFTIADVAHLRRALAFAPDEEPADTVVDLIDVEAFDVAAATTIAAAAMASARVGRRFQVVPPVRDDVRRSLDQCGLIAALY